MISTQLARALRDSGLAWRPQSGDTFRIDRPEADGDVYTVSEMTVEAHHFPTGTILGFNGTTEWALDSVDLGDSLWLPREDQLRAMLRSTFRSLVREDSGGEGATYRVVAVIKGESNEFIGQDAADAYGRALLSLIELSLDEDIEVESLPAE